MKNLFIIHGYKANTKSHWFQWLKTTMLEYGYTTEILPLPNSEEPQYKAWSQTLDDYLAHKLTNETIIVAHSLGVITTLDYLSHHASETTIKGLFLISGFNELLPNIPELDDFISQTNISLDNINAQTIKVIGATADPIVNIDATRRLSASLDMDTIEVPHEGHFLENEGYTTFEFLLKQITDLLNKKRD
ncbi:serine hydrolase family protein [Staphylococcus sp. 18_1_E_LY]|uniref:Serine hydrolase family protein n=1 Tax=Staphylococcus lloydii TaxID=2781774 RepID=A0A7T1AXU2_9STAP|nr:alpha/beta hydrolase [Staphylococcus lloydii]MBF7018695.1 serine hydrolase family protein [Staphylococcus lloydii]MBF7026423.1 serine hydrolase family protein [Staphylococcus lloydii]QPM74096.1 serine hydrolase family protein [Staphylococcus lloydii]